ncbi:MAG TPA: DUF2064 domain-containing protein [Gemmatimonadales bacterium]|nr:DUF2064 domain-containing protein [Gemmatimonadales bacterium]
MTPAVVVLVDLARGGSALPKVAQEVGDLHANRLYRLLLGRVEQAARDAGTRASIWYRPADAGAEVAQWLGPDADLRPQASGPLGARIAAAAAGTNLPHGWLVFVRPVVSVDTALLRRASNLLIDAAIVIGPAEDGGIYLAGGRVAAPAALASLHDAGPGALDTLRSGLTRAGITWAELPVQRVIETAADARAARLLA